jgi:MFS family permease
MNIVHRITKENYPTQFWLLFWGMLISTTGASMIWPFLMIYVSEKLNLAMTTVASLMMMDSAAGLLASFIVGPITDRAGRKITMIVGLTGMGVIYLAMLPAKTFFSFAILMTLRGLFNPLYRVGADAMVADLIPAEKRADAYALTRLSKNVGVALGPAIGGFVATTSYNIAFWFATIGLVSFGILMLLFAKETLPELDERIPQEDIGIRGYKKVLSDQAFMSAAGAFTISQIGATLIWVLLGVYVKQNYGILESQYGFIPMTNAVMVVLFQVFVTRVTKKRMPLRIMALGAFFYAIGVTSVGFGNGFWDFWASMVILTTGELMIVPTATTYVANLAPTDMRGRYMSIFALSWGIAAGIGPILGGYLNDNISPQAIWFGGGMVVLLGVLWFFIQAMQKTRTPAV